MGSGLRFGHPYDLCPGYNRSWLPKRKLDKAGPRVRIRLPPAGSLSHRCLPWLQVVRRMGPCEIRELLWQVTQPGTVPRASTASLLLLRLPIILPECRTAGILVAPGLGYAAAQARRAH